MFCSQLDGFNVVQPLFALHKWWVLVGFYFFFSILEILGTQRCHSHRLVCIHTAAACLAAWWEQNADGHQKEAIVWARGTVAFAGGPYLLITYVPYLSVLAIWFVAVSPLGFLGLQPAKRSRSVRRGSTIRQDVFHGKIGRGTVGLQQISLRNIPSSPSCCSQMAP